MNLLDGGGPPGTLCVVDDVPAAFARQVAESFAQRPGPRFSLVLSGGPLARRCYEHLAQAAMDWTLVDILMGDERCVAPDDPDANQRLVRETLVAHAGPIGSFHPMSCEAGPDAYERVVEAHTPFDLVHLGMGADGHTASLFPGAASLEAAAGRLVVSSADPNGVNPHARMTLTLEALSRARLALFTVSGREKRPALSSVRAGADLPAARVRAGRVLWLADHAAVGPGPDL